MSAPFAPYDPGPTRRRRGRAPRFSRVPLRLILPNLVTLLALCSGLTAIRMALEARWDYAIGAIVIAAVLDALDGRVARLPQGHLEIRRGTGFACRFSSISASRRH